jgi:nicotinamidase-related amidase
MEGVGAWLHTILPDSLPASSNFAVITATSRSVLKRPHGLEDDLDRRRRQVWQRLGDFRQFVVRSSFTDTPPEGWLREHGVDTVTIAGYMTQMCCDTTARQAVHRGFKVEFLRDATGTLALSNSAGEVTAEELHRSILCAQQMLLSEVLDVASWRGRL